MSTMHMDPKVELPRPIASGPHIDKYLRYRQISMQLNAKMMSEPGFDKLINMGAVHFGLQGPGSRIKDPNEQQLAALYDYSLWELRERGENWIQTYHELGLPHTPEEKQLLASCLRAEARLFHMTDFNPEMGQLTLRDVTEPTSAVTIIDRNLSNTLAIGQKQVIGFLRPVLLDDFGMTSGFMCLFPTSKERALVKEWNKFQGNVRFAKIVRMHETEGGIPMLLN